MKEVSNLLGKVQNELLERTEHGGYSDRDLKNKVNLINHWIGDKSSGRAYFDNVKDSQTIKPEIVLQNIEAANELIKVRNACSNCDVEDFRGCPYDQKQIKQARDFEQENGLANGTISPRIFGSKVCVKNCGTPGSKGSDPVYRDVVMRPSLSFKHDRWHFAYGPCPVKSDTYTRH